DETEYRLSKHVLELGVVSALLFGLAGVGSSGVALWNVDGSFPHPIAAAVVCGSFWTLMTVLSGWPILAYARHRLLVGSQFVRIADCFSTRELPLGSITRAVWRPDSTGGSLVLHGAGRSVRVRFSNYTFQECAELIQFFHGALA